MINDTIHLNYLFLSLNYMTLLDQRRQQMISSIVVTYHPMNNNRLCNALRPLCINVINKAQPKLKDLLGNPKDKSDKLEKSGIYQIGCNDCEMFYVGQTRRSVKVRYEEHISKSVGFVCSSSLINIKWTSNM